MRHEPPWGLADRGGGRHSSKKICGQIATIPLQNVQYPSCEHEPEMQSRYPSASVHPYHILRPVRSAKRWIYPKKQQEGGTLHYPGQWQGVIPIPEKTGWGWYSVLPPSKGIIAGNLIPGPAGKAKKKGSDPPKRKPFSSRNPATIRRQEQDEGNDDERVRGSGPKNSSTAGCWIRPIPCDRLDVSGAPLRKRVRACPATRS